MMLVMSEAIRTAERDDGVDESSATGDGGGMTQATRDDRNAFPRLDPDQIERATAFGKVEDLPCGTVIFERGERSVDFFIILKGRCEIYDDGVCDDDGTPRAIHVHGERGFTGELDLFSDRKIIVSGRIVTEDGADGQVLRIPRPNFAKLLSAEPDVGDTVMRAFILRRIGLIDHNQGGVILIGKRDSSGMLRLQRFLKRNGYPMKSAYLEGDDDGASAEETAALMERYGVGEADVPAVVCSDEHILKNPGIAEVADCLGLTENPGDQTRDVAVIGAGPAGLAAAVYGASEGLSTVIIEAEAPGGQAGTSSRIENYLGFPTGLSGQELAGRAQAQAQKFGATLVLPREVQELKVGDDGTYTFHTGHGNGVRTRAAVIACGARWRTLDLPNFGRFEGSGIHYAATAVEAELCEGSEVIVVGGGNSAGQAAVYLSRHAKCVHMLVRGEGLAESMSDYLLQRIEASDRIDLLTHTEVVGLDGDEWLGEVTWQNGEGERHTCPCRHVFLMIGAVPNSDWLDGTLRRDRAGFILTGAAVRDCSNADGEEGCQPWPLDREPYPLETSLPGVFAVGDIRSGSVKRVASAVGEGSVCVADLHKTLNEGRVVGA